MFEKLQMQESVVMAPVQLKIITKSQVVEEFEVLINPYCEQHHVLNDAPRPTICNYMVKLFHGLTEHRDEWLRKKIDSKFKSKHRVINAQKRKTKNSSIESTIGSIVKESIGMVN